MVETDPRTVGDPRVLGLRIATLRRAHGLSQRRLAEAAGVSHGYVALLELGRLPSPGKFRLDAVARALNLRTSDALLAPTAPLPTRQAPRAQLATPQAPTSPPPPSQPPTSQLATPQAPTSPPPTSQAPTRQAPTAQLPTPQAPTSQPPTRQPSRGQLASPQALTSQPPTRQPSRGQLASPQALTSQPPTRLPPPSQPPPSQPSTSQPPTRLPPTPSPALAAPMPSLAEPPRRAASDSNVAGSLEQVRPAGAPLLPVFRWGSCGDPRDRESPPDPDHLEYPPPGRETLIGPNGFGVVVKGDSMSARGIYDGDVVWVNPERPYQLGKVVLALVSDASGEAGMVIKTYARTDVGECLLSETAQGRSPVVCREFKVIGPVVGITSWRLPS